MKIVYDLADNIAIAEASGEILERFSLYQVATVIVPEGQPFWIVPDEELPKDKTFIDAIEPPDTEPDGYGASYISFSEIPNDQD